MSDQKSPEVLMGEWREAVNRLEAVRAQYRAAWDEHMEELHNLMNETGEEVEGKQIALGKAIRKAGVSV